jgi:hypothetical protein
VKEIMPDDQLWVNVADLIRNQIPDVDGKLLPVNLTSGTYQLKTVGTALSVYHAHSPTASLKIVSPAPRNHIRAQQKMLPQLQRASQAPPARVRARQEGGDIRALQHDSPAAQAQPVPPPRHAPLPPPPRGSALPQATQSSPLTQNISILPFCFRGPLIQSGQML